jgi:hypothetical protein
MSREPVEIIKTAVINSVNPVKGQRGKERRESYQGGGKKACFFHSFQPAPFANGPNTT